MLLCFKWPCTIIELVEPLTVCHALRLQWLCASNDRMSTLALCHYCPYGSNGRATIGLVPLLAVCHQWPCAMKPGALMEATRAVRRWWIAESSLAYTQKLHSTQKLHCVPVGRHSPATIHFVTFQHWPCAMPLWLQWLYASQCPCTMPL